MNIKNFLGYKMKISKELKLLRPFDLKKTVCPRCGKSFGGDGIFIPKHKCIPTKRVRDEEKRLSDLIDKGLLEEKNLRKNLNEKISRFNITIKSLEEEKKELGSNLNEISGDNIPLYQAFVLTIKHFKEKIEKCQRKMI